MFFIVTVFTQYNIYVNECLFSLFMIMKIITIHFVPHTKIMNIMLNVLYDSVVQFCKVKRKKYPVLLFLMVKLVNYVINNSTW